jgi:hypothetical protein
MIGSGDLPDHRYTSNCRDLPDSVPGKLGCHFLDAGKRGARIEHPLQIEKNRCYCACPMATR